MSTLFSGHYLHNRSTLDIGVLGYIGIVQNKEHFPEVLSIPPRTPCIHGVSVLLGQILGVNSTHLNKKKVLYQCMSPSTIFSRYRPTSVLYNSTCGDAYTLRCSKGKWTDISPTHLFVPAKSLATAIVSLKKMRKSVFRRVHTCLTS